MINKKRVVITGAGVLSSVGNNINEFWQALQQGKSGIGPITHFDASNFRCRIAGEIKGFDVQEILDPKEVRKLDQYCHYAIKASEEALAFSGVSSDHIDPDRIGVLIGSGVGGLQTMQQQAQLLQTKGPGRISPFLIPMMISDMASGIVSIRNGFRGPNYAIVSACASGTHAIGEAYWILQRGDADIMITGGTESSITELGIGGFCAMHHVVKKDRFGSIRFLENMKRAVSGFDSISVRFP